METGFRRGAGSACAALCVALGAHAADSGAPGTARDDGSLQEVVISASPISHDADRFATIVETVGRDRILEQGGGTLADALAGTPGVTGSGFAGGASRPVIRGFDANRVRVLEDGIGSFDVSDVGPDHGVPIDPLSARRIEVVRGAATLRYGSQAIGGVVNAINDRVPARLPEVPFSAEASASRSSGADAHEASALFDGRSGDVALHADGFLRRSDDYSVPGGEQSNSWTDSRGASLGASLVRGDSHAGLGVVHYESGYGIPGDVNRVAMRQTKLLARSQFAFDRPVLRTLSVDGGAADYEHSEVTPDGLAAATFRDREWDLRAEAVGGAAGPMSALAAGLQLQQRRFSALGEGADYLLPTRTRTAAAFAFTELPLNAAAHLEAGARLEHVDIDGTDAADRALTRRFAPFSASLGAVFDAGAAVRLGLLFASAARAPAQTELFARGPHDASRTYETGDPALQAERADSLEGSLRLRTTRLTLDLSLWNTRFSHYLYGDLTGRTCDSDGHCVAGGTEVLRELRYRQANAGFRGAEVKATVPLYDGQAGTIGGELLGDIVQARFAGGVAVPRIPPWHAGAGLRWQRAGLTGGVSWRYSGRRDDLAPGETPTAGFGSVDAWIGWEDQRSPGFAVTLAGHNLGDTAQRNAVSFNKDEVLMPGRDLRLTVRASF